MAAKEAPAKVRDVYEREQGTGVWRNSMPGRGKAQKGEGRSPLYPHF